jgi:signal transduction histidine kinase
VFERFYRSEESRTTLHADGYGLGLAIADQIIREHGGTITVESREGEGSTFTVVIPK